MQSSKYSVSDSHVFLILFFFTLPTDDSYAGSAPHHYSLTSYFSTYVFLNNSLSIRRLLQCLLWSWFPKHQVLPVTNHVLVLVLAYLNPFDKKKTVTFYFTVLSLPKHLLWLQSYILLVSNCDSVHVLLQKIILATTYVTRHQITLLPGEKLWWGIYNENNNVPPSVN